MNGLADFIDQIGITENAGDPKTLPPPLTPEKTLVRGRLLREPPRPEGLVTFRDHPFLNRGTVAACIAAGGTGKTTFFTQCCYWWSAGKEFAGFKPVHPLRTLFLAAEEDQTELDHKLWKVGWSEFPPGLHAHSVKGIIQPLMALNNGAPVRTEWFDWLDQTIQAHMPLDLLALDPKSRLYGLDENNNDHNTQWVACLESLSIKHIVSIFFAHHVPKHTKEINQWMGRGGGALIDACRSSLGMIGLTSKEGEKYGLDNWAAYIKIAVPKINIGPRQGVEYFLKFDEQGLLQQADIFKERIARMKPHFLYLLAQAEKEYTRRELNKEECGKSISAELKAKFSDFVRGRDVDLLLDMLLAEGSIQEGHRQTATRWKMVFKVLSNTEDG